MDSILHTLCSKKRQPFYFFNNSSQKLTNFNDFSYIKSWENLTRTSHTFVHLTCVQVWSTNLDDSRHRVLHLHQWSALWLNAQSLLHIGHCEAASAVRVIQAIKLIKHGAIRQIAYDFLLEFQNNYMLICISRRFGDTAWQKCVDTVNKNSYTHTIPANFVKIQ